MAGTLWGNLVSALFVRAVRCGLCVVRALWGNLVSALFVRAVRCGLCARVAGFEPLLGRFLRLTHPLELREIESRRSACHGECDVWAWPCARWECGLAQSSHSQAAVRPLSDRSQPQSGRSQPQSGRSHTAVATVAETEGQPSI